MKTIDSNAHVIESDRTSIYLADDNLTIGMNYGHADTSPQIGAQSLFKEREANSPSSAD